ncbi:DUF6282 family protein [Thermodesulfobacteriota bacterium]
MKNILEGAIDTHVHSAPDIVRRRLDDLDLMRKARERDLGGLVLKNHMFPTEARASLASKETGFRVWGGIALNLPVGGWNPWAVRSCLAMGGKIVWMPTIHARHMLRDGSVMAPFLSLLPDVGQALTALDQEGRILDNALDVIDLIAEADAVLATGHLAPEESIVVVREAAKRGVQRILLTHPFSPIVGFTADQVSGLIREVPTLWVEFTAYDLLAESPSPVTLSDVANWVKAVGPQRSILASDGGQASNPLPFDMLEGMLHGLMQEGFSAEALRPMVADNPRALLA